MISPAPMRQTERSRKEVGEMQLKKFKDLTPAEVTREGLEGAGGPEFLTLMQAMIKIGKAAGYSEEELQGMTLEEICGLDVSK